MAILDTANTRQYLQEFRFADLFIEALGWLKPKSPTPVGLPHAEQTYHQTPIARLGGVMVFELTSAGGDIPDAKTRAALHKEISDAHHESLLIFVNAERTQSLWYWVKRDGAKSFVRDHSYFKGQPGDLFLGKLQAMQVDLSELNAEGDVTVTQAADRLKRALDVERVTKKFYGEFKDEHLRFIEYILGIDDERDRRWYASVLLNRLMFIYFLQGKGFIDGGDRFYLQNKLDLYEGADTGRYYGEFLKALFFEGFAKPAAERSASANALVGDIVYLNGGLFLEHAIEVRWPDIRIADEAFRNLLGLFSRYSWNLNDTPGGNDDEINPDVLGYIFEKYINQKAFGAYYTRPEITEYLCEQTIHRLVLDKVNGPGVPGVFATRNFESVSELVLHLNADLCRLLYREILPGLSILDPACGSGAFLVAAMKTLINIYGAVIGAVELKGDKDLKRELRQTQSRHRSIEYHVKRSIITNNLFGVDIMEEAIEIAKLRLFLALVASADSVDELEPLPNIDFNIMPGNSLIGLQHVDGLRFDQQRSLYRTSYQALLLEKNRLIEIYRNTTEYHKDLRKFRDDIDTERQKAVAVLNDMLLDDFNGIKYEQATWDDAKSAPGKPVKRALTIKDIEKLKPFHWGYEFDEIMDKRGGFDVIITNPPWEIFKPNAKEFFQNYSDLVTKKKMTVQEFELHQSDLLQEPEIRKPWFEYQSTYPHVNSFFRTSSQYPNQLSYVNGHKATTDINLYKLFVEQCYNLIHAKGQCGIVIPSGIYSDLGAMRLREMLLSQCEITGLFAFENRKEVFEGVHRSFKFAVLTFVRGGATVTFPCAFMRHDVRELVLFPREGALHVSVDLIRRLSPDTLSIMEFQSVDAVKIARRLLAVPMLRDTSPVSNISFHREFHMTDDSSLFISSPGGNRIPLFEGKMIHQFDHKWGEPKYWIDEGEGRRALLKRVADEGQTLGYQTYRLGYRSVASSTNERTMIAAILPRQAFCGHSINVGSGLSTTYDLLALAAILNSFVLDFTLRQRVAANLTIFYIYQLPIPLSSMGDSSKHAIVERSARLICTTPEFDNLAAEVGLGSHANGATDLAERAQLRAELDGMIAHLYGLTEEEFAHVLSTFPLVPQPVKVAAQNAYRDVARGILP